MRACRVVLNETVGACLPLDSEPPDHFDLLQELRTMVLTKPRQSQGEWESGVVDMGRRVTDCVKVF